MKSFKKFLLYFLWLIICLAIFVFAPTAQAACAPDETSTEIGCLPQDPGTFVGKFYGYGLGLIGGVAVMFIVYAGYLFITSQGNPEQLNKAKSYIFYSIVGLLLAIFGFVFIRIVGQNILRVPGFG